MNITFPRVVIKTQYYKNKRQPLNNNKQRICMYISEREREKYDIIFQALRIFISVSISISLACIVRSVRRKYCYDRLYIYN